MNIKLVSDINCNTWEYWWIINKISNTIEVPQWELTNDECLQVFAFLLAFNSEKDSEKSSKSDKKGKDSSNGE